MLADNSIGVLRMRKSYLVKGSIPKMPKERWRRKEPESAAVSPLLNVTLMKIQRYG